MARELAARAAAAGTLAALADCLDGDGVSMDAASLLPPASRELGDLFENLSLHLRRALRTAAELRSAWEASRRAVLGLQTSPFEVPGASGDPDGGPAAGAVVTLGEGRIAAEMAAANRALRARLRVANQELAALRK